MVCICPACNRDVAPVANRRLELVIRRHRTPLGKRCAGSGRAVSWTDVQVIRRIS